MSAYRGRTGPNFSEYLTNLNSIASPYDADQFTIDDPTLNDDLAMFTNTDFTSFDNPISESDILDFNIDNPPIIDSALAISSAYPTTPNVAPFYNNFGVPIQPAPAHGISIPSQDPSVATSPVSSDNLTGRRAGLGSSASPAEEKSRLAAEEDKRRRNTAASARFRVKKKQREQNLEKTVKEATDRTSLLETRLKQVELENKWLRDLITAKDGNQSKEELAEALRKFRKESEERDLHINETLHQVS